MANEYFTYYKAVDPFSSLGEIKGTFKPLEENKLEEQPLTRLDYIEQKKKERDTWFDPSIFEKTEEAPSSSSSTVPSSSIASTKGGVNPYKGKRKEWEQDLYNAYKRELASRGIDTGYAKWLVAQDAQETRHGNSVVGSYNYGNLTSASGVGTKGKDHDAKGNVITQTFLNFNSLDDYVKGKISFLQAPRYKQQGIFQPGSNPALLARQAKAAGYAADPLYEQHVNNVAKGLNLE